MRNEGVKKLSAICDDVGINFFFFCNTRNFFKKKIEAKNVSSMNWLATAKFFEKKLEKCLIIDFGSTTTDLIIIKNHKILNQYFNDFDRINNFASTIENKTRGLYDFDKELNMTKQAIFNVGRKNSYMIQKEKEKLSIIPMNPESYNKENVEEDSWLLDDFVTWNPENNPERKDL